MQRLSIAKRGFAAIAAAAAMGTALAAAAGLFAAPAVARVAAHTAASSTLVMESSPTNSIPDDFNPFDPAGRRICWAAPR